MTEPIGTALPLFKARIAGSLYLLSILAGICAATVANGGLSLAANLLGTACYVAVTLLLYDLLKPVDKNISLVAALFSLTGCAISLLSFLPFLSPTLGQRLFFPYLMTLGLIGEGALTVWLLVFGVNAERWMLLQRGH